MCTILIAWQNCPGSPVVLGSNRDELLTRPSNAPAMLQREPVVYGGRDMLAGGTWLGVDPRGRICAVTNRHLPGWPLERDSARRSRGEIALSVLSGQNDADSREAITGLRPSDFNPVNVVYVSPTAAFCLSLDDREGARLTDLEPGVHVVTVAGADVAGDPKSTNLLAAASAAAASSASADGLIARWRELLANHDRADSTSQSSACIHGRVYGTVSSATVAIGDSGHVRFDHADGRPCETQYRTVPMAR